jgi:hypothetical protein
MLRQGVMVPRSELFGTTKLQRQQLIMCAVVQRKIRRGVCRIYWARQSVEQTK